MATVVNADGLDWALAVIEPALVLGDRSFLLEMWR
jgi:hypothetical protein